MGTRGTQTAWSHSLRRENTDENERNASIASSVGVSLSLLDDTLADGSRRFVELAVFPEDTDVPTSALQALWECDEFDAEEIVEALSNLTLVRRSADLRTIRVHDVLLHFLEESLEDAPGVHARLARAWGEPRDLPNDYAWRWYAYHVQSSEDREWLESLLLDYAWLRAKLSALDGTALVADFTRLANEPDFGLIRSALTASSHALYDPQQLGAQLCGRLWSYRMSRPRIERLLSSVESDEEPALVLGSGSLEPAGGPLIRTLVEGEQFFEGNARRLHSLRWAPPRPRAGRPRSGLEPRQRSSFRPAGARGTRLGTERHRPVGAGLRNRPHCGIGVLGQHRSRLGC